MNVVDFESYTARTGYTCFNACLVNCMAISGKEVNSSDIYFSGNKEIGVFLEKYQIGIESKNAQNKDVGVFFNEEMKNANSHLLIVVRPEILGYSHVFDDNSIGYTHVIYIAGSDNAGVYFIDGYTNKIMGQTFSEYVSYLDLIPAWDMDGNEYCRIVIPEAIDVKKIKADAKQYLYTYIEKKHNMILQSRDDEPKDDILLMFWEIINEIKKNQVINIQDMNNFLIRIKVEGFLMEKNMIWEKINELEPFYADEYLEIIKKWNNILLIMRKYSLCNKVDKLVLLYNKIFEIVTTEDELLMKIFFKDKNE